MSIYLFAWVASVVSGIETIIIKLISKHSIDNPWLVNFFWTLFSLIFMIPIALWFGAKIPSHWIYILLGSVFYALASILYTISLYKLDVSTLAPLFSTRTAMSVIFAAVFLSEKLTLHQSLLIFVIFIFGIFVSIDEKFNIKSFFTRKILIALACMVSLVFSAACIKEANMTNSFWTVTLWITLLSQCWLLFTIPLFKKVVSKVNIKQYAGMAFAALFGMVYIVASNAAYSKNVGISSVIISLPLSMVIAFLFSVFAPELLEKHTAKVYLVRFVSAAIMILAALSL